MIVVELTVCSVGKIEVQRVDRNRTQHEEIQVGPQKVQTVFGYEYATLQLLLLIGYPLREVVVLNLN